MATFQPEQTDPSLWQTTKSGAWNVLRALNYPQRQFYRQFVTPQQYEHLLDKGDGIVGFRDVKKVKGLQQGPDTWLNWGEGMLVDTLGDPVNFAPLGALGKAGNLARQSGAVKDIGRIMSESAQLAARKKLRNVHPEVVDAAYKNVRKRYGQQFDLKSASKADLAGNPPVPAGLARRTATLRNLLEADAAGVAVPGIDKIKASLNKLGYTGAKYDKFIDQRLQNDLSVWIPFLANKGLLNIDSKFGGRYLGDALSFAGKVPQYMLDSSIGGIRRAAGSVRRTFDNKVGQAIDPNQQNITKGLTLQGDNAAAGGRRMIGREASKLYRGTQKQLDNRLSQTGNEMLADAIEKPKKILKDGELIDRGSAKFGTVTTQGIQRGVDKAIQEFANFVDDLNPQILARDKELGMKGAKLADPNNVEGYLARNLDAQSAEAYRMNSPQGVENLAGKAAASQMDPSMLARSPATKIPGGRNMLAFELGVDPDLVGPKRNLTDEAAAAKISDVLYGGNGGATNKQSRELAEILRRMPDPKSAQAPIYGQHPVETVMDYVENRTKAQGIAEGKLDHLASRARRGKGEAGKLDASDLINASGDGYSGRSVTVANALQKSGFTKQANAAMRDRIAQYRGIAPSKVNLSQYFIPESAVNSLGVSAQQYNRPAKGFEAALNWAQAVWRNSILLWPARFVRDKVGGMIINLYEGWFDPRYEMLASKVIAYGAHDPKVTPLLAKLPRYAEIKNQSSVADAFYADVNAAQISAVGKRLDSGIAGDAVKDVFVGADRPGTGTTGQFVGTYLEAMKNIGSLLQRDGKYSTLGARAGDIIDTSNRLSAYLKMLGDGVDPMEASREIMRAHVDYSSLTDVERWFRDRGMPFYTFWSRMLLEQGKRIVRSPGRMQGALELYTTGEKYDQSMGQQSPEYLSERGAFSTDQINETIDATGLPTSVAGIPLRLPDSSYAYGLDVPGFPEMSLLSDLAGTAGNVAGAPLGMGSMAAANENFNSAGERFISNLSPTIKTVAEQVTGTQADGIMRGQPIQQKQGNLYRALNAISPGTFRNTAAMRTLDAVAALSPAPRALNLARQLAAGDKEYGAAENILNTLSSNLTGFRSVPVNEMDRVNARLQAANSQLEAEADGYTSVFKNTYINQDNLSALDEARPGVRATYDKVKALQSQKKRIIDDQQSGRLKRGLYNRN